MQKAEVCGLIVWSYVSTDVLRELWICWYGSWYIGGTMDVLIELQMY